MSKHEMFLAMMLTNAKREEARSIIFTVERETARIDLVLLDGSSRPLQSPPPEIMLKIIECLEKGETRFESSVYAVTIENVSVQRGSDSMRAEIDDWQIEHV